MVCCLVVAVHATMIDVGWFFACVGSSWVSYVYNPASLGPCSDLNETREHRKLTGLHLCHAVYFALRRVQKKLYLRIFC